MLWVPEKLDVTDATSGLYGGTARFDYRLAPLDEHGVPTRASWDVAYRDVDLSQLTDFLGTVGIRLAGRITGRNRLDWALGKWGEKTGSGDITAVPPPDTSIMTREFEPGRVAHEIELPPEAGPFNPHHPLGYVPIAGHIVYTLDPEWITIDSELDGDGEDLRRIRRPHGVRRALAHPVSRDEPRLAGERSGAGRDHDCLRIADRRRADRRHGASSTA